MKNSLRLIQLFYFRRERVMAMQGLHIFYPSSKNRVNGVPQGGYVFKEK
jgi:hypothetical protein